MHRKVNDALLRVVTIIGVLLLAFMPIFVTYLGYQEAGWLGATGAGLLIAAIYYWAFSYSEADD